MCAGILTMDLKLSFESHKFKCASRPPLNKYIPFGCQQTEFADNPCATNVCTSSIFGNAYIFIAPSPHVTASKSSFGCKAKPRTFKLVIFFCSLIEIVSPSRMVKVPSPLAAKIKLCFFDMAKSKICPLFN